MLDLGQGRVELTKHRRRNPSSPPPGPGDNDSDSASIIVARQRGGRSRRRPRPDTRPDRGAWRKCGLCEHRFPELPGSISRNALEARRAEWASLPDPTFQEERGQQHYKKLQGRWSNMYSTVRLCVFCSQQFEPPVDGEERPKPAEGAAKWGCTLADDDLTGHRIYMSLFTDGHESRPSSPPASPSSPGGPPQPRRLSAVQHLTSDIVDKLSASFAESFLDSHVRRSAAAAGRAAAKPKGRRREGPAGSPLHSALGSSPRHGHAGPRVGAPSGGGSSGGSGGSGGRGGSRLNATGGTPHARPPQLSASKDAGLTLASRFGRRVSTVAGMHHPMRPSSAPTMRRGGGRAARGGRADGQSIAVPPPRRMAATERKDPAAHTGLLLSTLDGLAESSGDDGELSDSEEDRFSEDGGGHASGLIIKGLSPAPPTSPAPSSMTTSAATRRALVDAGTVPTASAVASLTGGATMMAAARAEEEEVADDPADSVADWTQLGAASEAERRASYLILSGSVTGPTFDKPWRRYLVSAAARSSASSRRRRPQSAGARPRSSRTADFDAVRFGNGNDNNCHGGGGRRRIVEDRPLTRKQRLEWQQQEKQWRRWKQQRSGGPSPARHRRRRRRPRSAAARMRRLPTAAAAAAASAAAAVRAAKAAAGGSAASSSSPPPPAAAAAAAAFDAEDDSPRPNRRRPRSRRPKPPPRRSRPKSAPHYGRKREPYHGRVPIEYLKEFRTVLNAQGPMGPIGTRPPIATSMLLGQWSSLLSHQ